MTLSNSIPAVSMAATVLLVAYNNLRKRCFQFGNFVSLQNVLQLRNDFNSYSSQLVRKYSVGCYQYSKLWFFIAWC